MKTLIEMKEENLISSKTFSALINMFRKFNRKALYICDDGHLKCIGIKNDKMTRIAVRNFTIDEIIAYIGYENVMKAFKLSDDIKDEITKLYFNTI